MASLSAEDDLLQIPATSPCRRDYQLRSGCDRSRSQSPWLPRSTTDTEVVSVCSLSEPNSPAFEASNCRSKSLPAALQWSERPYRSDPVPSSLSTIQSDISGPREHNTNELLSGKPVAGSIFRYEGEGVSEEEEDEKVDEERNVSCASHLSGGDDARMQPSMSLGDILAMQKSNLKIQNHLSENVSADCEKFRFTSRYNNENFHVPDECVGANNRRVEMRKEEGGSKRSSHTVACKSLLSGFTVRGASSEVKTKSSDCELPRVKIPFKWEDAPFALKKNSKKPHLRTPSSSSTRSRVDVPMVEALRMNSHDRFYGDSEIMTGKVESDRRIGVVEISNINSVPRAAAKRAGSRPLATAKAALEEEVCSAVPFNWEEAPGKPKLEQKASEEATLALQLPPRLAKRNSFSKNSPTCRNFSMSVIPVGSSGSSCHDYSGSALNVSSAGRTPLNLKVDLPLPSQPSLRIVKSRSTLATAFRSGPLEKTLNQKDFSCKRESPKSPSGPVAQFRLPQYQSTDFINDKAKTRSSVCSPTSTLCGPGSDGLSTPSSCSSKISHKSPTRVSFSSILLTGDSPEPWSNRDHASPTSRHPFIRESESQESSWSGSVGGHEEGESGHGETLLNVNDMMNRRSSRSKPQVNPISRRDVSLLRSVDSNEYSSHGEDYLDCQNNSFSSSPPFQPEEQSEPPTRLPYKMPSPPAQDIPVETECASAARSSPDSSICLGFPRFRSKSAGSGLMSAQCLWVANPSWNLPNEPSSSREDGFRSPAYKATLDLLSPPPNLLLKKSSTRSPKLWSSSSRRHNPHLFEAFCSSLKQSLSRCIKRSAAQGQSMAHCDEFVKRHQSFN